MTTTDRAAAAVRFMQAAGAPTTRANLTRLAVQYEQTYHRARASKRPPAPQHLRGMLDTARAFYSLARRADA